MKKTFHNIQGLRGVAVLAVIFFHLLGIERKYSVDQWLPDTLQLGAVGVDLFFMISGFIMMTVTRERPAGLRSMLQFLLQRFIRIYPLYWLASGGVIAGVLLLPVDAIRKWPDTPHYLLRSLLLVPQENLPLLSVGWTLVHEMYFYAMFCCLLFFPARWHLPLLALWSACTVFFWQILQPVQEQQPWLFVLSNPLTLEFTTGCLIALLLPRLPTRHATAMTAAGALAILACWHGWLASAGSSDDFPLVGVRVACFLLPCAVLLAGVLAMEQGGKRLPDWLARTGDASYALYLTHIIVLSAGGRLWQHQTHQSLWWDNWLWLPGLLAVTLLTGFLCHVLVEKPLLSTLRRQLSLRF